MQKRHGMKIIPKRGPFGPTLKKTIHQKFRRPKISTSLSPIKPFCFCGVAFFIAIDLIEGSPGPRKEERTGGRSGTTTEH